MKTGAKLAVAGVIVFLTFGLVLCVKSAYTVRLVCDKLVGVKITEMPHFSTRFTLSPTTYLTSKQSLQQRASWIVSYCNTSGSKSLGFQTDLRGNVLASGLPIRVPAVAKHLAEQRAKDQKIVNAVARADGLVNRGMTCSNVIEKLGQPSFALTNGEVVSLIYDFGQPNMPGCFLTNGIEVELTNGIVRGISHQYGWSSE